MQGIVSLIVKVIYNLLKKLGYKEPVQDEQKKRDNPPSPKETVKDTVSDIKDEVIDNIITGTPQDIPKDIKKVVVDKVKENIGNWIKKIIRR